MLFKRVMDNDFKLTQVTTTTGKNAKTQKDGSHNAQMNKLGNNQDIKQQPQCSGNCLVTQHRERWDQQHLDPP
eukprot:5379484-Amphidinium_carterae.1